MDRSENDQSPPVNLATVYRAIEEEFLAFVWSERTPSPQALKARHQRLKKLMDDGAQVAGPVFALDVFYRLEAKAAAALAPVAALAQIDQPEKLAEHGLPPQLIENASKLHAHVGDTARKNQAGAGAENRQSAKAMRRVRECWDAWQANSDMYVGINDFDDRMYDKEYNHLKRETISKARRKWAKDQKK